MLSLPSSFFDSFIHLNAKNHQLLAAVEAKGLKVVWITDPMHGNTVKASNGLKTRRFEDVCEEVKAFFEVHAEMGTHPGGLHVEMTGVQIVFNLWFARSAGLSHRFWPR